MITHEELIEYREWREYCDSVLQRLPKKEIYYLDNTTTLQETICQD